MNYIWEIALRAKENQIQRDQLFFAQAKSYSPWYEQAFESLNQQEVTDPFVEVNTLCRFDVVFHGILHPEVRELPTFRAYVLDLAVHLLCEIDLQRGLTRQEFYIRRINRELAAGAMGSEAAQYYRALPDDIKNRLAALLLKQMKTGSSLYLFRRALLTVAPESILYQSRTQQELLLVYLGRRETEEYDCRVQFVIHTFLPIGYGIRLFWAHHFGVLGVGATMLPDEMEIF